MVLNNPIERKRGIGGARTAALAAVAALLVGGGIAVASHAEGSPAAQTLQTQPNPFTLRDPEPGHHSEFGAPNVAAPEEMSVTRLRIAEPAAGTLSDDDAALFTDTVASLARGTNGEFLSEIHYVRDGESVRIQSWTPSGAFELFAPLGSPVKVIQQRELLGHPALTILASDAVVEGNPPRQAYVEVNGNYHSVLGEGFASNDEFLSLVERVIEEVQR